MSIQSLRFDEAKQLPEVSKQKSLQTLLKNQVITFIGGGNMTRSLLGGLVETGVSTQLLRVADISPTPLAASHFPVQIFTDNLAAIKGADVVVLAVKPQIMQEVAMQLAAAMPEPAPLFVSIAAGVRLRDLQRWLGERAPVVRVMPNTPSLVQSGAAALFADARVNATQRDLAEGILRAVGLTVWLDDEQQMDAVTALSGSGPAYFFLVMEAMQKAATDLGLSDNTARLLTLQTAFGAAKMALESREDAASLRARVTSKGGTTERAIHTLQNGALENLFAEALQAAHQRSVELAEQFSAD